MQVPLQRGHAVMTQRSWSTYSGTQRSWSTYSGSLLSSSELHNKLILVEISPGAESLGESSGLVWAAEHKRTWLVLLTCACVACVAHQVALVKSSRFITKDLTMHY